MHSGNHPRAYINMHPYTAPNQTEIPPTTAAASSPPPYQSRPKMRKVPSKFRIVVSIFVLFFACKSRVVSAATFTFVNKCDHTVWPGILGSPDIGSTGFELPEGSSRSFQAPAGWSGRFWARSGCQFDGSGQGSCRTGDCGSGKIECSGAGAAPPATLAEFTLGSGSQDFYDVSLVDGYNLPILVEASGGSGPCSFTGCVEDLNQKCPAELRTEDGGGCRSACEAFGTPEYCCKGDYASPATCTPSVYSQIFKSACPKSYSYAYDDASSTFTCTGADYTLTFCPSGSRYNSGAGAEPSKSDEYGSGSEPDGSVQGAMLADGSWLARLATGDAVRERYSRGAMLCGALVLGLAYLIRS